MFSLFLEWTSVPSAFHHSSRQAGSVVKRLYCVSAVAQLTSNHFLRLSERYFRDWLSAVHHRLTCNMVHLGYLMYISY